MSYRLNDQMMPGASRGRVRTASRIRGADVSLRYRRRWYAEDDKADTDDNGDSSGTGAGGGGSGEDDTVDDDDTPALLRQLRDGEISAEDVYSLITGLRVEAAAGRQAKKQLTDAQKAQEEADRKRAEDQGEYKKLWDEAQPKLERLSKLEEADNKRREELGARNESRIKELPKDKQTIVRNVTNKLGEDPYAIAEVLDELLPTLTNTPDKPGLDGGSKGDSKGSSTPKPQLKRASY